MRNFEEESLLLMRKFHLKLEKEANRILEEKNLTLSQSYILMLLHFQYNDVCEFKKIEKRLDIAQSTTVNLINKLEQKGYVKCHSDINDKRVKLMNITEKGKEYCIWVNEQLEIHGKKMFKGLTDEEREIFCMLLKKICENLL